MFEELNYLRMDTAPQYAKGISITSSEKPPFLESYLPIGRFPAGRHGRKVLIAGLVFLVVIARLVVPAEAKRRGIQGEGPIEPAVVVTESQKRVGCISAPMPPSMKKTPA